MLRLCYMSLVSRPTSTSFRVETNCVSVDYSAEIFPLDLS
jgi:hypothetical protein